jgi:hypothetical protein
MLAAPSRRPKWDTVVVIQASTAVEEVMSRTVVRIVGGFWEVGERVCRAVVRVEEEMSARERSAPWAWSCFATERPMPAKPVIA